MKNVLISVDTVERFRFFKRMINSFNELDYRIVFLTNKLSIYLLARKSGYRIFLINRCQLTAKNEMIDLNLSLEFSAGYLSHDEAMTLFTSAYQIINKIQQIFPLDLVLIWNGTKIIDIAISQFCRDNQLKIVFMEIANIPGRLFADSKGVNAKSTLLHNVSLLDQFDINEESYEIWKRRYLKEKFQKHVIPQANTAKKINLWFVIDYLGFRILNVSYDNKSGFSKKILEKFSKKNEIISYDDITRNEITQGKYIFFPMQVSNDSQILLNSTIGNVDAIRTANELAKQKGLRLYVKPHPAEQNIMHIKHIAILKKEMDFYLVNGNTFELIQNAQSVIVINSTIGLEAKIIGKDVTFLGKSFYPLLDEGYLKKYILGYLIDIDYFGQDEISVEQMKCLMQRAF